MSILYIIKIKKQKYYILCFVIEIKIIFKNAVIIYVFDIIFIHERNFIKFSCVKCFTKFWGGGIFTSTERLRYKEVELR